MKHTTKPTQIGLNRTGVAASPKNGQELASRARDAVPQPSFDTAAIESVRLSYSEDAEPVGTLPPPATAKGVAKAAVTALKGDKANVLLDLIGDRLAFERTGTRIYEALFVKLEASESHPGGPTRADLEEIRNEELAHAGLLCDAMIQLGGDPTAMTPSADISAVASEGILKVVTDPRTTLTHALQATLSAELTDTASWMLLTDLADKMGQDQLAERFREALSEEEEHEVRVRTWLQNSFEGQAGVADQATMAAPPPAE
jgi:rubrerythrin